MLRRLLRKLRSRDLQRDSQGAVAIFVALITCFVLIPVAALAVDIGVQRVARTDMQSLADVIALDLARDLKGGNLSDYSMNDLNAHAHASRDRNDSIVKSSGDKPAEITVKLGTTTPNLYGVAATDAAPGYFKEATQRGDAVDAVQVTASTNVDFGLANALPGGGIGKGGAARSAIATGVPDACFKVGSFALGLDTTNESVVNGLLNNALLGNDNVVGLGVLGYKGLANADISLLRLTTALSALNPDKVLDLSHVSLGDFVVAAASALGNKIGRAHV